MSSPSKPFFVEGPLTFSSGTTSSSSSLSLRDSISTATRLLIESNFDDSLTLINQLLRIHPSHPELLDLRVECLVCQGGGPTSSPDLLAAVVNACSANPDIGYSKWMYMGQMSEGETKKAQKAFCKGISIIDGSLSQSGLRPSQRKALLHAKCCAFVSIAELFMTPPGCDEADAEFQCETAIRLALETDAEHAEALHCLASLRMVQQRDDEAESALDRCLSQLSKMRRFAQIPIGEAVRAGADGDDGVGDTSDGKDDSKMADDAAPSAFSSNSYLDTFDLRLNVAKMCVELGRFQVAERLLSELYEENDSILEIQHLFAVVKFHRGKFTQCGDIITKAIEAAEAEIATMSGQKGKEAKTARKEMQRLKGIMIELRQNAESQRSEKGDAKESEDEGEDEEDEDEELEEEGEEEGKNETNGNGNGLEDEENSDDDEDNGDDDNEMAD